MENYICINGKKAELTEEQMRALGIEVPKQTSFTRAKKDKLYYSIDCCGEVEADQENFLSVDDKLYAVGNYCTDENIMRQRALHETLNRLLWRYAMERERIEWNADRYYIYYDMFYDRFDVNYTNTYQEIGKAYFPTERIALSAIKEIIEPFMKAHPEFKW